MKAEVRQKVYKVVFRLKSPKKEHVRGTTIFQKYDVEASKNLRKFLVQSYSIYYDKRCRK
jgi:hypothetical protein